MNRIVFMIQVPMGDGNWFDLCRCATAETAAAVVRALLEARMEFGVCLQVMAVMEG